MSSYDVAYRMHVKAVLGYDYPRRSVQQMDPESLFDGVGILRRSTDITQANLMRKWVANTLGIPLDEFIGDHGAIDDDALARTALYAARSATRFRERRR